MSFSERKSLIVSEGDFSIVKQCEFLGISRSSYYYKPKPESEKNFKLMKIIDQIYTKYPFTGSRRMVEELDRLGEYINRKRVQRLRRVMGIITMYPRPKKGQGSKLIYKYPYLLGNFEAKSPNSVWGTDITYIPMEKGFLYLTAILDFYSRYVVSWSFSDTLESDFCIEVVKKALQKGFKPQILNSDQGSQYTSLAYTNLLKVNGIDISMSGKGRCWDNILVERLWRTIKYEEVYLKNYESVAEAKDEIGKYLEYYNDVRLHSTLGYKTPKTMYLAA